jgi:propanol-preferring alcohol dehydrogenase
MRAAVLESFGEPLVLADVEVPQPGEGEILIRVERCGVCHSDLHIIDGDTPRFRAAAKPRLVPGHEVVGRVEELGPGVTQHRIGDRVGVAWRYSACGQCEMCRTGHENVCPKGAVTGMTHDGGYAQFIRAKADWALPIPDALTSAQAAPLFCAGVTSYRALKNAGVGPGQRVAVFGVGGLGHLAVQIAKALGAEIVGMDISEEKLRLARELGATHAFNSATEEGLKALVDLGGAHVAIVTSAAPQAYAAALQTLRRTGTISVVGLPAQPLQIPALAIVAQEARIMGSAVGTRQDVREILAMAAEGLVRCHVEERPMEQVNSVLDEMRQGRIQGRVVLVP